jgi:ABC-type branched-subunit amino acid transport system substrate-binding protein
MMVAAACGDDDDDSGSAATSATSGSAATTSAATATTTGSSGSGTAQTSGGSQSVTTVSFNPADNKASDIGITPTEIHLGTVVTTTGPVPGLFAGSAAGTDAFFQYVNSQGGVYGRKLVMDEGDDGYDCNRNQAAYDDLKTKVFAFVGSFSVFDNCAAKVLSADPNLPDIHYQLSTEANNVKNSYSPQPQPPGFRTGPYKYYQEKFPDAVTKIGALYSDSSQTTYQNQKAAMESLGFKIIYARAISATETDFTADVVRMKDQGVKYLDLRNTDNSKVIPVLMTAAQQGFKPDVVLSNTVYSGTFFDQIPDKSAADGVIADQQYAMFLGEDAAAVPEVKLFDDWMKQTHPDTPVDLFAAYSWASARLFVQALTAAGQNPTRADLIKALDNVHDFDSNGMVAKADPGNHAPPECWMLVTLKDGKFQRTLPPGSGFDCSHTGYFKVS